MAKLLLLVSSVLVAVNAGTYGGQKIMLEDIERDYNTNGNTKQNKPPAVPSPTNFGFVPKRTASSYAATQPKQQYLQTNYKVKQPSSQAQSAMYHQQYIQPQTNHQYSSGSTRYISPVSPSDNTQSYSSSGQQYIPQQPAQDYSYVQPEPQQQVAVQYQQPDQQYEQLENVQYVSDNSLPQADAQAKQYHPQSPQPQYYYVQQYQSPSFAVESVIDPKAFQYVTYVPSSAPNSISIDQKQLELYTKGIEPQLPPVTTTVTKYTSTAPGKTSKSKHYSGSGQKTIQYVGPSNKGHSNKQDEFLYKREPKNLLDSYVPSIVQLQYLKQQRKRAYSS